MAEFCQILKEKSILILLKLFQKIEVGNLLWHCFMKPALPGHQSKYSQEEKLQTLSETQQKTHPKCSSAWTRLYTARGAVPWRARLAHCTQTHRISSSETSRRRASQVQPHIKKPAHTPEGTVCTDTLTHGERALLAPFTQVCIWPSSTPIHDF